MPLYVTVRAGASPATSVPVLVVADQRLVQALVDELARLADTQAEQDDELPTARLSPRDPRRPHVLRRISVPVTDNAEG